MTIISDSLLRHDWDLSEILNLLDLPFIDLIFRAQELQRVYHKPNHIYISSLLSLKTGACSEDCGYCAQSVHHHTDLKPTRLLSIEEVITAAKTAQAQGATRFCMGAAWRNPTDHHLAKIIKIIKAVNSLGLETCVTLGMLTKDQACSLKAAGLDYYNHNLDTSPEFYNQIITTHTYQDRLTTLEHVLAAGIKLCSGGILGLGESRQDRAALLQQLANLSTHPESVPINLFVQIEGTKLFGTVPPDPFELIRVIATARILMPKAQIRLAAGRHNMSDELHALCFLAGANAVFCGERLLTTSNIDYEHDQTLFKRLGLTCEKSAPPNTNPGACQQHSNSNI